MQVKKGIIVGAALAFAILALVFNPVLSPDQTSGTFSGHGLIRPGPVTADYTIAGANGAYMAVNSAGTTVAKGSDVATVITSVLGMMSTGQTVAFIGNFAISSSVDFYNSNITLDFGTTNRAIVTSTVEAAFIVRGSYVTIRGGDFSGGDNLIVAGAGSGTHLTIDNAKLHDVTDELVNWNNNGGNVMTNCSLYNANQCFIIMATALNNKVLYNVFHDFGAGASRHGIYLASDTEIAFNTFYNNKGGAGILLKGENNSIHDNEFYNMPAGAPPISCYTEWLPASSNNEIYNNNFHDCYYGIIFGNDHDVAISTNNRIHDNTFTNVTYAIYLPLNYGSYAYDRTFIYYNTFINCGKPFASASSAPKTLVTSTVIAYNTFSATLTDLTIETFTNTMVTGNSPWMADYNPVTDPSSPYYIPPP